MASLLSEKRAVGLPPRLALQRSGEACNLRRFDVAGPPGGTVISERVVAQAQQPVERRLPLTTPGLARPAAAMRKTAGKVRRLLGLPCRAVVS